jgi:multicomponent Na+:H+ antiporter subunit D
VTEHLPVLLVVVPLVAAPLIVLARSGAFAWGASLAVAAACATISAALLARTTAAGPISYAIGSWAPPWGIEYRVDAASALVALLVSGVALLVVPYARRSASAELGQERQYLFYALFMLCLCGLLGMTVTGDAFNLFVFLEISSLSTYALIALGRDRRALTAAFQYLVLGTTGATFYVIGIGMLYLATGTLNLADLAARLPAVTDARPVVAGFGFIAVGIALKAAIFPLHAWLPNAYAYAPSAVSAFIAGTATKVSLYVLMRIAYVVFGSSAALREVPLGGLLAAVATAGLILASASALFQKDVKRLLAYSSVGQIGYIALGISLASVSGATAALAHLVNHGLTKSALFLLAGGMALRLGGTGFDRMAGVGRTMPVTSFAFVLMGFSLVGVPGTAGFVTKWALVTAALEGGHWWMAAVVLASSLISLAYVWRFAECAYFREPPAGAPAPGEAPLDMTGPALSLGVLVIALGMHASPLLEACTRGARALLGVMP